MLSSFQTDWEVIFFWKQELCILSHLLKSGDFSRELKAGLVWDSDHLHISVLVLMLISCVTEDIPPKLRLTQIFCQGNKNINAYFVCKVHKQRALVSVNYNHKEPQWSKAVTTN